MLKDVEEAGWLGKIAGWRGGELKIA